MLMQTERQEEEPETLYYLSENGRRKFGSHQCQLVRSVLYAEGFTESRSSTVSVNLTWTVNHLSSNDVCSLGVHERVNNFLRSSEITRKDRLVINVQRMQHRKGHRNFNIIPRSFLMPSDWKQFRAVFQRQCGVWIMKPCASSRGRGIELIDRLSQLTGAGHVVLSKYIENPLLIDGFKFDLRLYVAVTCFEPLRIYLFREGLGRFATIPYQRGSRHHDNLCMHLTNYSINKHSRYFVRSSDAGVENYGNKWSSSAVFRHLRDQGHDINVLLMRIEDVIIKTILCGELPIANACKCHQPYYNSCFELFGFDILIDDRLRPWVLEVNKSPSLVCDSPLDQKIKGTLICDLLSLVGFPLNGVAVAMTGKPQWQPCSMKARYSTLDLSHTPLPSTEKLVLAQTRDEYTRRGNFIRIFPTVDSWELYGFFLENKSPLNLIVHSGLYPNNANFCWPPTFAAHFPTVVRKRMEESRYSMAVGVDQTCASNPAGLLALQRLAFYTTSLSWRGASHTGYITDVPSSVPPRILNGSVGDMSFSKLRGMYLSQAQLREVFASYLDKVCGRLAREDDIAYKQASTSGVLRRSASDRAMLAMVIEKVGHFLLRASRKLRSSVSVAVPSESIPLAARCRLLVQELRNFIDAYRQDTDMLLSGERDREESIKLHNMLLSIREADLEAVLAHRTAANGCSGILSLHTWLAAHDGAAHVRAKQLQIAVESGPRMHALHSAVDEKSSDDSVADNYVGVVGHTPSNRWREPMSHDFSATSGNLSEKVSASQMTQVESWWNLDLGESLSLDQKTDAAACRGGAKDCHIAAKSSSTLRSDLCTKRMSDVQLKRPKFRYSLGHRSTSSLDRHHHTTFQSLHQHSQNGETSLEKSDHQDRASTADPYLKLLSSGRRKSYSLVARVQHNSWFTDKCKSRI